MVHCISQGPAREQKPCELRVQRDIFSVRNLLDCWRTGKWGGAAQKVSQTVTAMEEPNEGWNY